MKIKFLRQWHQFTIGAVTDTLGAGVCAELIRRGFAEEVTTETTKAIVKPKANKMLAGARNK